jgi:arsenite/tail-anchored protein-transporting ATPase
MRTILYTGKGGVGKTSTAAATALRCAKLGHRTIVLSTDLAHSLADSLDRKLAAEPLLVAENLWAQEVDVYHEIHRHWGAIQDYIANLFAWRGLDEAIAEEMTVPPGMEELSSLLLISRYARDAEYDVCIVDTAPTGETLRLLSFPEVARWWVRNIMPLSRRVSQVLSPVARRLTDMPMPSGDVFDSVQSFLERLDAMHQLLSDPTQSTVRLVVNPEKMVIKEAQRTFTYLNLYGYSVDAIVCNRILPDAVGDDYFGNWKDIQRKYFELIQESFEPIPIFRTPLFDEEMVGERMLGKLADAAYGDLDPTGVLYQGRVQVVTKEGDGYVLSLALPLASKPDIEMMRLGEDLVVRVGNQRRNVVLPRALVGLEVRDAKFEEGHLRVRFG